MYLRLSRQKRADGSTLAHLQIAENVWDPEKKRSQARIVYNCGRADDPAVTERLKRLAHSILRRCSPEDIVASQPNWRLLDAWPYGDVYVLEKIWRHLGIDEVIADVLGERKFDFPVERALFAMVANRACAPASKLYCYEQWLGEDVKIAGTDALQLHHLYRAMDFLAANHRVIEEAVYYRMADLLNADVELIFYDTTSLHFEVDDEDEPQERATEDGGRGRVLRRRGKSKNGRDDAPQLVVGLAVTRDGLPVCHWIFPGNTVDVSTVEQVKRDLRGWRLARL